MSINEKDRLDLRQEFEKLLSSSRLADIAMEAMPPIDYANLATKADLVALGSDLRGEMRSEIGALRGEMGELRGEVRSEISLLRGEMGELRGDIQAGDEKLRGEIGELRGAVQAGDEKLRRELQTGLAALRGQMDTGNEELRGELMTALSSHTRTAIGVNVSMIVALGAWVTAFT